VLSAHSACQRGDEVRSLRCCDVGAPWEHPVTGPCIATVLTVMQRGGKTQGVRLVLDFSQSFYLAKALNQRCVEAPAATAHQHDGRQVR